MDFSTDVIDPEYTKLGIWVPENSRDLKKFDGKFDEDFYPFLPHYCRIFDYI